MNNAASLSPSTVHELWQAPIADSNRLPGVKEQMILEIVKDADCFRMSLVDREGNEEPIGTYLKLAAAHADAKLRFGTPFSAWIRMKVITPC